MLFRMTCVFQVFMLTCVDSERSRDVTVTCLAQCLYRIGHPLLSVSFLRTASQVWDSPFFLVYCPMGLFLDLDGLPDPTVVLVALWLNDHGFSPVDGVVFPFAVLWFSVFLLCFFFYCSCGFLMSPPSFLVFSFTSAKWPPCFSDICFNAL